MVGGVVDEDVGNCDLRVEDDADCGDVDVGTDCANYACQDS